MNSQHPKFSLSMELLALLPIRVDGDGHERHAVITELADDLGLKLQSEVETLRQELETKGFKIERFTMGGVGRCMAILPESWEAAKAAAQDYWQNVYGPRNRAVA